MRDRHDEIEATGGRAVVVVCQNEAAVRTHFARDPMPFPVAIDQRRAAARAFGVYVLLGFDSINIARPSTFLVDAAGLIRLRAVGRSQFQRLPIDELLAGLRAPRQSL